MRLKKGSHEVRALCLAAALAVAGSLPGCGGQTYNCGDTSTGHCHGIVTWKGSATGLSMELTAVPLNSGFLFITDEAWLIDAHAPGNPLANASWVEVGEISEGPGTEYFWADNTPSGFTQHLLGPVAQSDTDAGNWIAYSISQVASDEWKISISQAATGTPLFTAQSFGNPMTPNKIETGQELAGTQDAQAPLAFFAQNASMHGAKTTFQTTDGVVTADHPLNAGWWGVTHASQTANGGIFFTDCC